MIETIKIKAKELKELFNLVKTLRAKLNECNRIKKFYEDEIREYNKRFAKGKK